jgi:transposase
MNGAFPVALRAPYNAPFIASNQIPLRSCFGSLRLHLKLTFAARFTPIPTAVHTHEYTYAYGAVDVLNGELDSLILPHVNTECMQIFLDEVGARHPMHRIILVLDGAGWHASTELKPPGNMKLLSLPPYAPELNPVEHLWDELREKHFHNKAFDSIDALEDQLQTGLLALENDMPQVKSIVAWDWIVNALLK